MFFQPYANVFSRIFALPAVFFVCLCACGARVDVEAPPASCPSDPPASPASPGCIVQASNVSGSNIVPTMLTIPETSPTGDAMDGYWIIGSTFAVYGGDGKDHFLQLWSDNVDSLVCGKSLSLVPASDGAGPDEVVLRIWGTGTDFWASSAGKLEVIEYEQSTSFEKRPLRLQITGASMIVGPTPEGSAPNMATGTFTADVSCWLESFENIPQN